MALKIGSEGRRNEYARFILAFLLLGLTTKIIGEFTHEAGHAFLVILLGGRVENVYISFEWPFSLSHTVWFIEDMTNLKFALVSAAGILSDTVVTALGQLLLLRGRIRGQLVTITVFWMSFWTYLNSVVYLVVGAIHPFGDMYDLLSVTRLPGVLFGVLGLILLGVYTRSLSLILRGFFSNLVELGWANDLVNLFWILMHMLFVLATVMRYGLPMPPSIAAASLVLIFTVSYVSGRWIMFSASQLKGRVEGAGFVKALRSMPQHDAAAQMDGEKKERIGYAIILSAALVSVLATGVMVNQYVTTYNLIMRTDVSVNVTSVHLGLGEPVLDLSVAVANPTQGELLLKRVEFEVKLNGKYMTQETIQTVPPVSPEDTARFHVTVTLPSDRGFTIDEAIRDDSWDWTVQGTSYVDTMFGETLLRFKCYSTARPG